MIEEPLTICPECGGHIRRVLYPAGIVFKGSGFYKTDHGNGAVPASKDSNDETKAAEEKSKNTSSESKPSENGTGTNGTDKKSASDSKAAATTTPAS
jgi:predicted nucleic acid-binding Zn ribbon protein